MDRTIARDSLFTRQLAPPGTTRSVQRYNISRLPVSMHPKSQAICTVKESILLPFMNLFLPYPDDLKQCARFLDDGRLNKQVVEAYQIGTIVLKLLRDPLATPGWRNHPSTKLVFNNGTPKWPWLEKYIVAMDDEWKARGFKRSEEFTGKLCTLFDNAQQYQHRFSHEPVCAFVGGGELLHADSEIVGEKYRAYLQAKFETAASPPRWSVRDR
jgi:hypothetical protein